MTLSATSFAGPATQPAPRHVPDLRPAADAAAMRRETRPAPSQPASAVAPPSPAQAAAVTRSMVATVDEIERSDSSVAWRAEPALRTLKPYGVMMLPRIDSATENGFQRALDTDGEPDDPPFADSG